MNSLRIMETDGADKLRENKLDWLPEKDDLLDLCNQPMVFTNCVLV